MVTRRRASTSLPAPLLQDDYDGGRVGLPAFWGSGHLRNKKNASGQAEAGRCGVCSEQGMLGGRGDRGGLPSLGLQLPPRSVRRFPSILSPTWRRDGMQGCCRGTGNTAGGRGSRPRGRSLLSAPQCKGPSSGPDFKNKVPFSPESFTQCILD